ncbi:protein MANBAL [Crotalus adamanteus]|uniref:Protein MANBAL n=1 Tax=Crotalus adamanteus TaxID=8729 RepID=A0AAW1BT87_CROAD
MVSDASNPSDLTIKSGKTSQRAGERLNKGRRYLGKTLLPAVAKGGSTSWGIGSASGNEIGFELEKQGKPTFMENILHYGLFFGAIFQLICVLAIILPVPKTYKMDTECFETKSAEVVKKPKIAAISVNKKLKKETKKKR